MAGSGMHELGIHNGTDSGAAVRLFANRAQDLSLLLYKMN
jgi:hypothetical protein